MLKLPPLPTILDLIGKRFLTSREVHRVYDGHDPGDEEPRRHGLFVCGIGARQCSRDPNHFGPHDWQIRTHERAHSGTLSLATCRLTIAPIVVTKAEIDSLGDVMVA